VVAITGQDRGRADRLLAALGAQTIASDLEAIIIDLAPEGSREITPPAGLRTRILRRPGSDDWGAARAGGVRSAQAQVVAFLEDHTVPEAHWAEELDRVFVRSGRDCTAACYAFTNGSPDTYFYRSVFMTEYGALAHPLPEGPAPTSTANNIAYRRDALLALGEGLDELLEMDFFLQRFMGRDFRVLTVPGALLAHETNTDLRDLMLGHFEYARLFANRRLRHEEWNLPKRIVAAMAVPLLVPALRLKRLFGALRGRPSMRDALAGLPVILLLYVCGALGEAWGLLRGGELSASRMIWLELSAPRAGK
jgi:GT2 family glycosyltransferase